MRQSRRSLTDKHNVSLAKSRFRFTGLPKGFGGFRTYSDSARFDGYEVSSYEDAGVVIVNTCGFIDSAKEESLAAFGEGLE